MMRAICLGAALLLATTAMVVAGDMTPQQAWDSMMNCPVCSVWGQDPTAGPNIRCDVFQTQNGYIESFNTADAKLMPTFQRLHAECMKRANSIPTMSKEDQAKLCPVCQSYAKVTPRKDVNFQSYEGSVGWITVASSNTPEGTKALQDLAVTMKRQGELLTKAAAPQPEVQKSKM